MVSSKNSPAFVPTSPGSSSSSSSSEDALEVRQRAFELLNRMGPETPEDKHNWPKKPIRISSYQNGNTGDASREAAFHVVPDDDNTSSWGGPVVQGLVQCVSDACKLGASEIVSQNAAFARSGYQTLKSVIVAEAQDRMPSTVDRPRGTYESVPIGNYQRASR